MSSVSYKEIYYSYIMRMADFNLRNFFVKWGIYINIKPHHFRNSHYPYLVPQNSFLFMFLIWVSNHLLKDSRINVFFSNKKAQILFLISFAGYCPPNTKLFNVWKNQFLSIITRNDLEYLSKWIQISYTYFWFTR